MFNGTAGSHLQIGAAEGHGCKISSIDPVPSQAGYGTLPPSEGVKTAQLMHECLIKPISSEQWRWPVKLGAESSSNAEGCDKV